MLDCPNYCASCTDQNTCQSCEPGYGLYNDLCESCRAGTYLSAGYCECKCLKNLIDFKVI